MLLRAALFVLSLTLVSSVTLGCGDRTTSKKSADADDDDDAPKKKKSKKRASAEPSGETSGGSSASAGELVVTMDGAPVTLRAAFIKRRPPGVYQLYATSGTASCQELLDNFFDEPKSEKRILLDLTETDGVLTISEVYTGARWTSIAPGARATLVGKADAGSKNTVTLDFSLVEKGVEVMRVNGALVAEGCGERPPTP